MTSKRKGLSVEEKRERLLELFYDSNNIFQIKELETVAPKEKGIIPQSVKEITQSLVDDGLVECEKIGTLVCYWSFPSKAAVMRRAKLTELDTKIDGTECTTKEMDKKMKSLANGREATVDRNKLLVHLEELKCKQKILSERIDELNQYGPVIIDDLKVQNKEITGNVNRWTGMT